ncbi:hypothetical protein HYS48_04115 [Candidatus Woesearchaeota archaeon]|nr:hypothetical protein [Candidatus Woesearchaeota archaeon]
MANEQRNALLVVLFVALVAIFSFLILQPAPVQEDFTEEDFAILSEALAVNIAGQAFALPSGIQQAIKYPQRTIKAIKQWPPQRQQWLLRLIAEFFRMPPSKQQVIMKDAGLTTAAQQQAFISLLKQIQQALTVPSTPTSTQQPPADCTSWFDGCNTCEVVNGQIRVCTKKACTIYEKPKCLVYSTQPSGTASKSGVAVTGSGIPSPQPTIIITPTGDGYCGPGETVSSKDCFCLPGTGSLGIGEFCGFGQTVHGCSVGVCSQPMAVDRPATTKCGDNYCAPSLGETLDTCPQDCSVSCSPKQSATVFCDSLLKSRYYATGGESSNSGIIGPAPTGGTHVAAKIGWVWIPHYISLLLKGPPYQSVVKRNSKYYFKHAPSVEIPLACVDREFNNVLMIKRSEIGAVSSPNLAAGTVTLTHKEMCDIRSALARTAQEEFLRYKVLPCEKIINLLDPSTMQTNAPSSCGDLWCNVNGGENLDNCLADCMPVDPKYSLGSMDTDYAVVLQSVCGNGVCNYGTGETSQNCPKDCDACNMNNVCDATRDVRVQYGLTAAFTEGADCQDCIAPHNAKMKELVSYCTSLKGSRFTRYQRIGRLIEQPDMWGRLLFSTTDGTYAMRVGDTATASNGYTIKIVSMGWSYYDGTPQRASIDLSIHPGDASYTLWEGESREFSASVGGPKVLRVKINSVDKSGPPSTRYPSTASVALASI